MNHKGRMILSDKSHVHTRSRAQCSDWVVWMAGNSREGISSISQNTEVITVDYRRPLGLGSTSSIADSLM